MYSILIKVNPSADKYAFYLNSDSTVYTTDSLETLGTKIADLLNTYTLGQIVAIKNCNIANNIVVTEATAE